MPRFKLKQLLSFGLLICCLFLTINLWLAFNESAGNLTIEKESQLKTDSFKRKQSLERYISKVQQNFNSRQINKFSRIRKLTQNYELNIIRGKPWFMNGTDKPEFSREGSRLALWPEESPNSDRIVNQLMYVPINYTLIKRSKKLKKILLYFGAENWGKLVTGQQKFIDDNCPVNTCEITKDKSDAPNADAIIFMNPRTNFVQPKHQRRSQQIWILYLLESPLNTDWVRHYDVFNWTATYRHDSDIVTPYEKFVSYDNHILKSDNKVNYAEGKSKKVVWFVSNCRAKNVRLEYARELSKYIQVDIYGRCGDKTCSRKELQKCLQMINKDYKFYLAFENSNCRDYITEKFFTNGLGTNSLNYNLIPIVMGAHPIDYDRSSPPLSYIHVDDFDSVKSLAEYLHFLDTNHTFYNQYFDWKSSGEFINTYFWCRVCALLHAPPKPSRNYKDISKWWRTGVCNDGKKSWNNASPYVSIESNYFTNTLRIVFFIILVTFVIIIVMMYNYVPRAF